MKIVYKARGNGFIFRGADNPGSFKSITSSDFPISKIWFEEVDQFKVEEDIQIIIDSILREKLPNGMRYQFFYSYNPPKRKQHWLNKKYETQFIPDNTYVHHSYYYHNPYLSEQTLEEIENTKETNKKKFEWMYLGKPIGGGVVPFDNLVFRTITDEELKSFDNIRQGIDWGYAVDPFAFGRWHYDKTRNKIYAIGEVYGVQMSNKEAANKIIANGWNDFPITADSAEPKSIAEMKDYGLRVTGAIKGAGSVEYGEKWLNDLDEIVIDPNRTPNIAREFENIDYQVDKDGNVKSKLEDKDNHSIDLTRYAFERDMNKSTIRFFKTVA